MGKDASNVATAENDPATAEETRLPDDRAADKVGESAPMAGLWVRLMLGLGVTAAIGLAPFLGHIGIPGFVSLLSVFPVSIQTISIAISSLLMSVIATAVQFYGSEKQSRASLRRHFGRSLIAFTVCLFVLMFVHMATVVRVPYAEDEIASFVIGFSERKSACLASCPDALSDAECVHRIGLATEAVESCWGSRPIRLAEALLLTSYLAVMGLFGALVGLLTLVTRRANEGRAR